MTDKQQVLISGAGPAGLTAALMFHQRGWKDIVVLERRADNRFERGKAFNYQLDGRGQQILAEVGIGKETLEKYGLPNDSITVKTFMPNGRLKSMTPPVFIKDRKTPYWMFRISLLKMLCEQVEKRNTDGRIRLLYGHEFQNFQESEEGALVATALNQQGQQVQFQPDLLLGCDGLRSNVRAGLSERHSGDPRDFEMEYYPSPSAKLMYKVIQLPPRFPIKGFEESVDNHELAYAFPSIYKKVKEKVTLFALPVADEQQPRNVNIILPKDHDFWKIESPEELKAYMKKAFPQLDVTEFLSEQEMEEFSSMAPGQFPEPQFSRRIHACLNRSSDKPTNCLLLGDAAHAFPPDLGMGVNSALEDLYFLGKELDKSEDLTTVCEEFEQFRLPDNASLVRLVQKVFPYQYNQVPWRFKLWAVRFFLQLSLTKITRGLIEEPGWLLTQHYRMRFSEMERRKKKADRAMYVFLALVTCSLGWLVGTL